jgi:TolB-like protein/cytochrome c-type biogenesis protein CcmH/NrfG
MTSPNRPLRYQTFLAELKRRHVFKVAAVYGATAFVVLQLADIVFPSMGLPEWTIPLIVGLTMTGFPLALVLAWAFETTPDGVRRTDPAPWGELEAIVSQPRGARWPSGLLALLGVVLLFGGGWWVLGRGGGDSGATDAASSAVVSADADGRSSIAVLPFENLSADPENAFFASGVHEDILTYLSRVREFRVISRTSVEGYAGRDATLREVANELGVTYVVEGSVRRSGNRVRVTAQLIDANSDEHLWAENYDRQLADVFAIQTAVAQEIVTALQAKLTPEEERSISEQPTENIEAYELYLRARVSMGTGGLSLRAKQDAERLLEQAVALDPQFARAYALLAQVHGGIYWFAADRSPERLAAVKQAIDQAFDLDPDLPEARLALATYYYRGFYDYERALEQLEMVRRQLPSNADVLYFMGLTLRRLGRWDESVAAFHEATLLDPANVTTAAELINTALDAGDLEAAREASERLLARYPDNAVLVAQTALLYLHGEGDIEAARRSLDAVEPMDEWTYAYAAMETAVFERDYEAALAVISEYGGNFDVGAPGYSHFLSGEVLALAGDAAGAEERLERARAVLEEEVGKPYANPYVWPHLGLAMTYAYLGEAERALESCRRAQTILPESKDKVHGVDASYFCAFTRARVGETDDALAEIERLLHTPSGVTRHQLALDPRWDFLRDDPRFQVLATP